MNQPATILVVDDIAANRLTICELLDTQGYLLLEAADGPTALRLAAENQPDLVLLDVMMPGMDGYEVCRRLRADMRLAEVPVIMVTALDDQASRLAGLEAGADDFVTKPYNRTELRARTRAITRLNRYRRLHESQTALHSSEERYRSLFTQMGEGFCLIELLFDQAGQPSDYRFLDINPSFEKQSGLTDVKGKTVRELIPNVEASWIERLGAVALTGDSVRFVNRVEALDRWFDIHAFRTGGPAGRNVAVLFNDISERIATDQTLRNSEKRFKALFEQAAVGVAQVEVTTGRFLHINRRCCEILGYDEAGVGPLTFDAITHPQDVGRSAELIRQVKAGTMREFTEEKRYLRKDGSEVWASVTVSAMWSPGETPDFFIAVVQDVTARKRLEDQVRQAQKMEAIGTLAGGIAHDFNNVLAAINGYTELAKIEVAGNVTILEYLDAVLHGAKRATDLVRQILTFSRQQELERKPMQLRLVVEEALELLRATIPATIEFQVSLDAVVPNVLADASQIHQIMMNLCTNAAHAMNGQPGRLTVNLENFAVDAEFAMTRPGLQSGSYVRLSVSDTGSGMDQKTLSRIFEPFFTTKSPGEGTGLGLAVVHGIMQSHDGTITVSSHVGEGTTFHLYFPAHVSAEAETVARPNTIAPWGHGERILYLDDEELLAVMGGKILERLGYVVEAHTNALEALAAFRAHPEKYDLVVTDQMMPGMIGTVFAEKIHVLRADLPIILTTGYSATLTAERIQEMGIWKLLLKPLTFDGLGSAVGTVLTESKLK